MRALFRIIFSLGLVFFLIPVGMGIATKFGEGIWLAKFLDKGLIRIMVGCGIGLMATAFVFFRGNFPDKGTTKPPDSKPNQGG